MSSGSLEFCWEKMESGSGVVAMLSDDSLQLLASVAVVNVLGEGF